MPKMLELSDEELATCEEHGYLPEPHLRNSPRCVQVYRYNRYTIYVSKEDDGWLVEQLHDYRESYDRRRVVEDLNDALALAGTWDGKTQDSLLLNAIDHENGSDC